MDDETRDERPHSRAPGNDDLHAGMRVGRYRLEREIGAGGMGVVWAAIDPALARAVAIKFLRTTTGHADERFLREARAMAKLSHPNVVAIFDLGTEDGRAFFAMELVEGPTLGRWLEGTRTRDEIVERFVAAGHGLVAAHGVGLVHRDFKPSNVLIDDAGKVKVADFGIVKGGRDAEAGARIGLTNPGMPAGTDGYIAPEVLAGEEATAASDQYAFAVSLRDALERCGSTPDLDAIVNRGMAMQPEARFPSVAVLVEELRRVTSPDANRIMVFGFPPTDTVSTKRRQAAELLQFAEARVGRALRIRPTFAGDYRALAEDLAAGRLDAAWLPPLLLQRTADTARPVLAMQRLGRTTFRGALIVQRKSPLRELADLQGKRIGWVDEDSAGGYVFPRALIAKQFDVDRLFAEQRFFGTHRGVVEAVANGWVDVGATFVNFDTDGIARQAGWLEYLGERATAVRMLAVTPEFPSDVIAVRAGLPEAERLAIVKGFLDVARDERGAALVRGVFSNTKELVEIADEAAWRAQLRDAGASC